MPACACIEYIACASQVVKMERSIAEGYYCPATAAYGDPVLALADASLNQVRWEEHIFIFNGRTGTGQDFAAFWMCQANAYLSQDAQGSLVNGFHFTIAE
jgi:hypothetical protein